MLTPEELANLPKGTVSHFEKLEADLICDIARRIRTAGTMTNTAEWQMLRMQELGAGTDYIRERLRQTLQVSQEEIDRLFEEAAERSSRFDALLLNRMGHSPEETMNRPYIQQAIQAARDQAGAELENLTRTSAFRLRDGRTMDAEAAFRNALDYTQWQVASGGVDRETAIRDTVRELADSGLRTVLYASGIQRSIEAAVRACVVTGLAQITAKISEANADLLGTDVVEVSAHPGARPEHAEWQGKWFSLRGSTPDYPNLAEATGYGTPAGLKGPNCRHDFYPVIPGISEPAYTEEELEALANPPKKVYDGKEYTLYEATQKQRQIERKIRQSKLRLMGYREAGLEADCTAERIRLRRLNELYTDFSQQTGLVEQKERLFVAGNNKKSVTSAGITDILHSDGQGAGNHDSALGELPVCVAKVDFSDQAAVLNMLSAVEEKAVFAPVEINCSVTTDGRVWLTKGSSGTVHPEKIEEMKASLQDSFSYHNHPIDGSHFSLSEDDVRFFFRYGQYFSKASDEEYEYFMMRTGNTLPVDGDTAYYRFKEIFTKDVYELGWDGAIDIDTDGYHETMKRLSEEYHFIYKRRRRSES